MKREKNLPLVAYKEKARKHIVGNVGIVGIVGNLKGYLASEVGMRNAEFGMQTFLLKRKV
jgi:hypothetical protein